MHSRGVLIIISFHYYYLITKQRFMHLKNESKHIEKKLNIF